MYLTIVTQIQKYFLSKSLHKSAIRDTKDLYSETNLRVIHFAKKIDVPARKVLKILSKFEIREYNEYSRIFHPEIQLVANHLGISQTIPSLNKTTRPPIVAVMGHVDHGKTTLLDSLRNANVAENEPGLITQHVSSFVVNFHGRDVTFIDTPGHAAFSGIRGRGAKINDVTVLVVDCCEGVCPQTKEVINLIHNNNIPCVVALNKIDREDANVAKTEQELLENGIRLAKFNGNVSSVEISALKRVNLDDLVQKILLESENINLETDKTTNAFGFVLETKKNIYVGGLATILPLQGTIHIRDVINSGLTFCQVRNIFLPSGVEVEEVTPGYPCTISGWRRGLPTPGLRFIATYGINIAKRISKSPPLIIANIPTKTPEDLIEVKGDKNTLCLVLKSDTEGSKEALEKILTSTSPEELKIHLFTSKIGDITLSDLRCAAAVNAHVLGFNVKLHSEAVKKLKQSKVSVFSHNIVYRIIDYVRDELGKILAPECSEERIGLAEIISGPSPLDFRPPLRCKLLRGSIDDKKRFRIISTDGVVRFDGFLQEFESEDSIKVGSEFEMRIEYYGDYDMTDYVECYTIVERKRTLVWNVNTE